MSRFHSHINTAVSILSLYKGEVPFSIFLKSFFAKEKKYGSRDRRTISSLCYNYFRIGNAATGKTIDEQIFTGLFLCNNKPVGIFQEEKPDWYEKMNVPLAEKILIAGIDVEKIFPFTEELSEGIDTNLFNTSFLIQPELFIRIRPGKHLIVKQKLETAQLAFEEINPNCFALENGTKLEEVVDINREVVIQDVSSQRVGAFMSAASLNGGPISVWDCCAASGGKSIMAYDLLPGIRLTASDIRQSIIQNLHKRFREAGINNYKSFIADVTNAEKLRQVLHNSQYDFIICDAPCSGSGTWSRTPEQLKFFDEKEITRYSNLQKDICKNTIPYLKKGGYFLYITCSVLKKENEKVVEFITEQFPLSLIKMELLKGYGIKADTMFAALFQLS
jgi:16S rRNA (cytosine967-C5)-methyltransferase